MERRRPGGGRGTTERGNIGGMFVSLKKEGLKLKTSVALPRDIQQEARDVAKQHGVSLSDYIVRLLRADLTARKLEKEG
jgi:hypothetical protein